MKGASPPLGLSWLRGQQNPPCGPANYRLRGGPLGQTGDVPAPRGELGSPCPPTGPGRQGQPGKVAPSRCPERAALALLCSGPRPREPSGVEVAAPGRPPRLVAAAKPAASNESGVSGHKGPFLGRPRACPRPPSRQPKDCRWHKTSLPVPRWLASCRHGRSGHRHLHPLSWAWPWRGPGCLLPHPGPAGRGRPLVSPASRLLLVTSSQTHTE